MYSSVHLSFQSLLRGVMVAGSNPGTEKGLTRLWTG